MCRTVYSTKHSAVFAYPLVSSKVSISLGFKGCIPLRLSPTPSSKRVLGHH